MEKKVLVPLAPGFEEIEALAVVDILRRAGATVLVAGIGDGIVTGRSAVHVVPDVRLDEVYEEEFDMVVLPGGAPGTENLKKDERVKEVVRRLFEEGKYVTAICAAPTVLSAIGLIEKKRVTCHPSVVGDMCRSEYVNERVVVDGQLITSQGPGTAIEFAYALVEALYGAEKVAEINTGVLAPTPRGA
ncbi:MAG: DJ-1/PfpI family protein [Proteobacteria bacterium]|nr:DJ-1/PfpI family protein [Pseudomonadota bacterium]